MPERAATHVSGFGGTGTSDRLDRAEVIERFRELRRTGDRTLRNQLVEDHRWIAMHCARRFARRGEPLDDLLQVAQLGVVKAAERFDPEMGVSFTTFAMPTVLGELRRHFRDATWAVRVPRRAKDLHLELAGAVEQLSQKLRRAPTVAELAVAMHVTQDDVLEAMEAGTAYRAAPLTPAGDEDDDDDMVEDGITLGKIDPEVAYTDDRIAVRALLAKLPPRERRIVYLRFFEELTQSEIAELVGISQVHVSRLLRSSLALLRQATDAAPEGSPLAAATRGREPVEGLADVAEAAEEEAVEPVRAAPALAGPAVAGSPPSRVEVA